MVFKTEIADVNAFKEMMKALLVVNKEATITFEEEGLTCEVMDTSHVMEILWRLDKSVLNHYEFGVGDTKATLEQLMKFIDDSLSLELNEETSFILDKVQPVVAQGRRCSDVVTIELTTDMPMKLDFETDKGKLEYYIAPTIGG